MPLLRSSAMAGAAAALFLCASLASGTARAAPQDESPVQKEAREAFTAGERAFARADYAQALSEFERTFGLVPHDAVRFNIGVCLERLSRYRDATLQYERAAESTTLSAAERQRARTFAERTRRELGTLIVRGPQSGAPVAINGEVRCNVPCRLELDPRSYTVVLALAGERERTGRIEPGVELAIDLALEKKPPAAAIGASNPAPTREIESRRRGPGWLTWAGGALALGGATGAAVFGLRTEAIHDEYVRAPTIATRDDGVLSRTLTNTSIVVTAVGAALATFDLVVLARRPP